MKAKIYIASVVFNIVLCGFIHNARAETNFAGGEVPLADTTKIDKLVALDIQRIELANPQITVYKDENKIVLENAVQTSITSDNNGGLNVK